jgi:hypothetical protein
LLSGSELTIQTDLDPYEFDKPIAQITPIDANKIEIFFIFVKKLNC